MNIEEAKNLLEFLENSEIEDVRVVVQLPSEVKIGDFIPSVKSQGYAAMVQKSALANAEVVITNKVSDGNSRLTWS